MLSGVTYYYVVTAFNTGGDSAPSNESTAVIPGSSVIITGSGSAGGVYPQPVLYGSYPAFGVALYLPLNVNGTYPASAASGVYEAMTTNLAVTP